MLATRIAALRKGMGLSQSQLARTLHISPSTAGMYEQGRRTPNIDILVDMANLFSVSLDYLLTGSEFQNDPQYLQDLSDCPCCNCKFKRKNRRI